MDYKQYMAKRNALQAQAQGLIDAGKVEEANAKMEEIRALDAEWDGIAKAQANMRALEGEARALNVQGLTDAHAPQGGQASEKAAMGGGVPAEGAAGGQGAGYRSEAYKNAWAKRMMGAAMTQQEEECYRMVNEAFTHTTKNTGEIIPESVAQGIWQEVGEIYPYWNDVSKTYVKGTLTLVKEAGGSNAGWYEEDTPTGDGREEFQKMSLSGCELSRAITVSWKLKEMAIEDFLPYIQRKMAQKMGAALGYGATHGKGQPGTGDSFKPEPMGIVTALEAQEGTPQVVEYEGGRLGYEAFTKARSLIKGGYAAGGLHIYANASTIWNDMANVKDANGRPILMADVASGGVYRVLSMDVREDDSMQDGEILISNPSRGYVANVNKEISVTTEDHAKARTTDYCAYAIVDGNMLTPHAHALLKRAAASGAAVAAKTAKAAAK